MPRDAAAPARPATLLGLLLMLGAVTCFVAMVVFVKLLREGGMGTFEVMWWRMAPGIPWLLLELRLRKIPLRPRRPAVVASRALFGGLAMGTYFWAVRLLTLFQNVVLQLSQPVFVAVGSPVVLGERLRGAAMVALALALVGAAVVILPDAAFTGGLTEGALLATLPLVPGLVRLLSSMLSALAHMSIRMATSDHPGRRRLAAPPDAPETVVLYFTVLVATAALALALAAGELRALPPGYDLPQTAGLVAGMATAGLMGQLLLSRAYARASAPVVAIVGYAAVPLGMLGDALVWHRTVGASGLVGAVLMIAAGILLVRAQRGGTPTVQ